MATKKVQETKITSFEELKKYSKGAVVELPSFGEGQPLTVRVKRDSLIEMVQNGTIPNPLMTVAMDLFYEGMDGLDKTDEATFKALREVYTSVAKAILVEPTYEQIEEAGLRLTDEQLLALYNYNQAGVSGLIPFRA